jgi:dienelactone hydrolase
MKRVLLIVLVITAIIGVGGWYLVQKLMPPKASTAALDPAQATLANAFLDLLDAHRYDEALAMATSQMREGLGGGKLKDTWEALPKQLGERQSRGALRGESIDGRPIITSALAFPMLALDARITFDANNLIAGFRLVPAQAPTLAHAPESGDAWHEVDLAVGQGADALPGTLTLPRGSGPFAAVVLVHGSGPHDRDETIGPNKPFRDLAHGLADRGIAVLRYEKRTKAHPEHYANGDFTIDDETVNDALAAVAALRMRSEVDTKRIFVAGHSLGAMFAPRIGQRDPDIAGLVLLAAPALRLEDTVIRQMRYIAHFDGRSDTEIDTLIAPLERQREAVKHLDADKPQDEPLLLKLPKRYWLDLNTYDPIAVARDIAQPMLILQGGHDYQVTAKDDFSLWQAAFGSNPRIRLIEYPLLGHTFMPGNDPPGPKDYQQAAHVDAKVIVDIAEWITARQERS